MLDALRVEVRHAQRDVRHPDAAPVRRDLVVGVEGVAQRPPGAVLHHEAEERRIRRDHAVEAGDARRPQLRHDRELALEVIEHSLALGRRHAHERHLLEHDAFALILGHEDLALAALGEPVWKSASELGYVIAQKARRVDGVGRPKFDVHTVANGSSST